MARIVLFNPMKGAEIMKNRGRQRIPRRDGFTLIETMLALTLITGFILGLAQIMIHSLGIKNRYDIHLEATAFISSRLETLKAHPYESPKLQPGMYGERLSSPETGRNYLLDWTIGVISPVLKEVEMQCRPEGRTDMRTRVTVYISRSLGF